MYVTHFKVTGVSDFPVDMLRYDACYPASQEAVANIRIKSFPAASREDLRSKQTVELCAHHSNKAYQPEHGRWQSFGWNVVNGSVRTHKA